MPPHALDSAAWPLISSPVERAAVSTPPFEWPDGLCETEAALRQRPETSNALRLRPARTWRIARRESIFTVFNLNLIGLAVIQLILGAWVSASMTLLLLGATTGVRIAQQLLADRRMQRYRDANPVCYSAIREGRLRDVPADDVVAGDALVAGPGDQIIADGPLLGPGPVTVDTSILTAGQSWRRIEPGETLHAGWFVLSGRAVYRAERIGEDRTIAAHARSAQSHAAHPTRLERLIARILRILLIVVGVFVAILLAKFLRIDIGEHGDTLAQAAPVIFSLIPTGMYLMIIVSYAVGMVELAQHGGLVHSARSIETLAETTVLCFTEAGTLTGTALDLTVCADPSGAPISRSRVRQALGDFARSTTMPTAAGRLLADEFEGEKRVVRDESANLSTLGWSALSYGERDAHGTYVFGRRDVLAPQLTAPLPGGEEEGNTKVFVLAHRPEAVALRDAAGTPALPDQLMPLGQLSIGEDADADVADVIRAFRRAGVEVKAFAVGGADLLLGLLRAGGMTPAELSAIESGGILSRRELEEIPRAEWGRAAREHILFGGLTPVQVAELIQTLRDDGEVVTVVGDGISDLPALSAASLSVAQPTSTQAAVGIADMVLRQNEPRVLLDVLRHGQRIVGGLLDVIKLNMSMVICTALLIVYVRTLTVGFPYLSSQGSIISILTATIPSIFLGLFPPPPPDEFNTRYAQTIIRFSVPAGVLLSLVGLAVYEFEVITTGSVPTAQLAVAYLLLYAGLALNLIIRPRRRFAILIGVLTLAGTLAPLLPQARRQFRIDWMEPHHYLVLAAAVAIWLIAVNLVWRYLGLRRQDGRIVEGTGERTTRDAQAHRNR